MLDGLPVTVQEKLLPTVATGWKLWIPAHAINFGFIPPSQRVLYVNVIAVSQQLSSRMMLQPILVDGESRQLLSSALPDLPTYCYTDGCRFVYASVC